MSGRWRHHCVALAISSDHCRSNVLNCYFYSSWRLIDFKRFISSLLSTNCNNNLGFILFTHLYRYGELSFGSWSHRKRCRQHRLWWGNQWDIELFMGSIQSILSHFIHLKSLINENVLRRTNHVRYAKILMFMTTMKSSFVTSATLPSIRHAME